jgi:hypothetical protein
MVVGLKFFGWSRLQPWIGRRESAGLFARSLAVHCRDGLAAGASRRLGFKHPVGYRQGFSRPIVPSRHYRSGEVKRPTVDIRIQPSRHRLRAHPAAGSVALKDQNKLAGGVPKDTPFQRLRRPGRVEFDNRNNRVAVLRRKFRCCSAYTKRRTDETIEVRC